MCVLGVEGSEKKCAPSRIISGTALRPHGREVAFYSLDSVAKGQERSSENTQTFKARTTADTRDVTAVL